MGVRRFDSVWDAIADTTEDAANLRLRSELMDKITALIDSKGLCCTTRPADR